MERLTNSATTTLNGSITNVATTLVVTSPSPFPASPNFTLEIENEILLVTGVSSDTFTVTRAQEGTTGAAHTSGLPVRLILSAASVNRIVDERFKVGNLTNYADATHQAELYQGNDAPFLTINRAYAVHSPVMPIYTWLVSDYTWFNQGSSTITQTSPFSADMACASTSGDNLRGIEKAYSGAKTIEVWITPNGLCDPFVCLGVVFKNNSNNKCISFQLYVRQTAGLCHYAMLLQTWTDFTTSSGVFDLIVPPQLPICLRGADDSVNTITWSISHDGLNFTVIGSTNYSGLFTPNRIGICHNQFTGQVEHAHFSNLRVF